MADKRKYNKVERYINSGYVGLANAVVKQAADDYRAVLRDFKRFPESCELISRKQELESFFNGEWIMMLTNADGNYIMRMLQKEAGLI